MLRALRTRFARIDERPVELIDKEIDDEFAAHLAQLEQDLIDSGTPAAKARDLALSRFGNPHTHKRRCLDVALKERRVKTYLQMTMTFACALLLAVTAATAWYNHRQTTHALDQMATRMDELHLSLNTSETPLNALNAQQLCPGAKALEKINASLR